MSQDIHLEYQKHIVRGRRRSALKKAVSVMACAVIFCTTYALILPAITMEQETFCGIEEHIHSEECINRNSRQTLICTGENLQIHTHSNGCFDAEGNLTCGKADYVVHTHEAHCYDASGILVCTLPERAAHVHTDSCYVPGETQPEVLHVHDESCSVPERGRLICTKEEYEGHAHGDACYEVSDVLLCTKQENHIHNDSCYTRPLICSISTEPHIHGADCRGRGGLICTTPENHVHGDGCRETTCICENTDENHSHGSECYSSRTICTIPENHSHGDSCYEPITVCSKTEGECHVHDDGCYGSPELICGEEENHIHGDVCYESRLTCTTAEDPGHTHGDSCYSWETVIGCGLEEGQPEPTEPAEPVLACTEPVAAVHVHTEACFETVTAEPVLICTETGADHIHTPECYELLCGMEAHSHGLACFSDPEADLETAEDWEATFAHVELTGNWNEDVIAIAETQLGYAESSRNYAVWADETTHGYTRYGQWYGSPYGDWCAMFVSFCLHYAEVEGMPLHWGVRPWIEELTDLKLYHEAEVYEPKPGDVIFYDWEGDDLSDHVGFVAEIIPATEDEPAQVKALEGNSSNCVQYVYYDIDDSRILGYSELPDNPEIYSCGLLRHSHNEYCYDDAGNFICQQIEHTHTEVCEPRDILYCGLEEHAHTETCFDENGEQICILTEHTHTESCTVEAPAEETPVYHCGLEAHTHTETCFDENGELLCEIPEHIHTEECTAAPAAPTYYCGLEEHTHVEACCNEAGELVCEIPEHTHTEECTVQPVTYYCFMQEHTHTEVCYDASGNLLCQVPEHVHTDECTKIPVYLCGLQEHTHGEECYDDGGSLICQLQEHTHSEQCVIVGGYICGMIEHAHNENCYDAEGNFICTLEEHAHTDACKAHNAYACGLTEHTHGEACYDAEGNLICQIPEHIHTAACIGRNLYYSDMQIRVHAVIRGVEDLPRKLTLQVRRVIAEQEPQSFGDMQVAVSEQISSREQYLSEASFYEMYLLSEGEIYNLPETASVDVTMEFEEPIFTPDAMADAAGTHAFMLTPEGGMQLPPDLPAEEEAPAETEAAAEETEPSVVESVISNIASSFQSILTPALALDDASQLEEIPAGEQPEGEIPDDSLVPEDPGTVYDVSGLTGEDYGNASQGITSVTFTTNRISTFAVALANTTEKGPYWQRIESKEQLNDPNAKYMIISAEGNFALEGAAADNAVPVTLRPVKGRYVGTVDQNRTYYTISVNDDSAALANLQWTIQAQDSSFIVKNLGASQSLNQILRFQTAEGTCTLTYWDEPEHNNENCWRFQVGSGNNSSYLQYHPKLSTNFVCSNDYNQNSGNSTANSSYVYKVNFTNGRDMLIFKLLDETFKPTYEPDVVSSGESATNYVCGFAEEHNHDDNCYERVWEGWHYVDKLTCTLKEHTHTPDCEAPPPPTYYCGQEHEHTAECPTKPPYGSFREESAAKTGNTSVSKDNVTVNGQYYSDKATSQLEQYFRKPDYEASRAIDGMVRTDKSVIYGHDDYEAFSSYASNTFGVTLSALGQAYPIPNEISIQTPVDVVFILDCSGSMSSFPETGTKRAVTLVEALNDSIAEIQEANPDNRVGVVLYAQGTNELLPLDRYTATNGEYFVNSRTSNNVTVGLTGANSTVYRIHTGSTLKTASGVSYSSRGADTIQGFGTYTQAGIAMGSKVFHDVPQADTTFRKIVTDQQGNEYEFQVQRQPVFVLLSDGEPTYSTNMYMDALNGVHYGDGNGGNNNVKGIHGYYTILSANYYKSMVGIHYQCPALFYSIGLGIQASGGASSGTTDAYKRAVLNPNPANIAAMATDSSNSINTDVTSKQLYNLLTSEPDTQYKETYVIWPDDWTGVPHLYEPTMSNPYGKYNYADGAFFGEFDADQLLEKFNAILTSSLKATKYGFVLMKNTGATMTDYIGAGMEIKGAPVLRYGGQNFTQYTTRTLEDGTIEYTYSGKYQDPYNGEPAVDISAIKVYIKNDLPFTPIYMCGKQEHVHTEECAADCGLYHQHSTEACGVYPSYLCGQHTHRKSCEDGSCGFTHVHTADCQEITTTQRIQMVIPDSALPVYTPDLVHQEYYYEALPVRLIYQVGLTAEAEQAVLNLNDNGGSLTFYTNRWGGSQHARSDLFPSFFNPFYYDIFKTDQNGDYVLDEDGNKIVQSTHTYTDHTNNKVSNVTGTESYSTDCHWSYYEYSGQEVGYIYHELGNNGKLVFEVEKQIVELPVKKVWDNRVTNVDSKEISVALYKVTETTSETGTVQTAEPVETVKLNSEADWKHTFAGLDAPNEEFFYAIVETDSDGFLPTYSGGEIIEITVDNGSPVKAVKVDSAFFNTETEEDAEIPVITITNLPGVELPKTGGPGTILYTTGGLLLIAAAIFLLFYIRKSQISRP